MKRAAIIGCGTIFQVHLPIIVANPEIELCAVCDNNPAVQEKLPAAAKAVPFYTDYEELLEKEHPDVVHLCLPHYLHVPVSEYFASHGVNVFCEKPVGLNTAQAKEFVEFEAAHPEVKIGICLQNRLNRTTVELKKIIDGGEYGKVIGCRGFVPWFRGKAYYALARPAGNCWRWLHDQPECPHAGSAVLSVRRYRCHPWLGESAGRLRH